MLRNERWRRRDGDCVGEWERRRRLRRPVLDASRDETRSGEMHCHCTPLSSFKGQSIDPSVISTIGPANATRCQSWTGALLCFHISTLSRRFYFLLVMCESDCARKSRPFLRGRHSSSVAIHTTRQIETRAACPPPFVCRLRASLSPALLRINISQARSGSPHCDASAICRALLLHKYQI